MGFEISGGRKTLAAVLVIIIIATVGWAYLSSSSGRTVLKVFHAGSLSGVFYEFENEFERTHPDIDVQRESAGSVETIRKVTDLGKKADVLASADYQLIENMMMESSPRYADFYIQFARNQLVVAYTEHSRYKDEIDNSNWYDIFRRDDVNFGFSNPNSDPCGYRALMVIQLSKDYYGDDVIFEDLVTDHSSIYTEESGGNYTINAPISINPDSSIMMRPKETDLMAQLELGELDYLLIYRSVASQHKSSGVEYVELPVEIDLSAHEQKDNYGRVKVVQYADRIDQASTVTGMPIVYGITIPRDAEHFDMAVEFVKLVIGEDGRSTLTELGQPPITPPTASDVETVPVELRPLVVNV
ncbi:MAG: tungstate ABC transporter substrate-binding protein WtpA [Thermoplasmata archaeon]|nr:tungstate ABC transporter substrate-binding protein WtpA [Thermoplasmata archaeon]